MLTNKKLTHKTNFLNQMTNIQTDSQALKNHPVQIQSQTVYIDNINSSFYKLRSHSMIIPSSITQLLIQFVNKLERIIHSLCYFSLIAEMKQNIKSCCTNFTKELLALVKKKIKLIIQLGLQSSLCLNKSNDVVFSYSLIRFEIVYTFVFDYGLLHYQDLTQLFQNTD